MSDETNSELSMVAMVQSLTEDLVADALRNTKLNIVSSLAESGSEMLWMDSLLDQISVLKTREFSDAEYKQLADQFLLELKKPTRTLIRLMCVFITNMDNIFEGKKEKWFSEPLRSQKTIDISDVLDECKGNYSPEDVDEAPCSLFDECGTESKGKILTENEKKFYIWITENADRIRDTLAALSLGLLRIHLENSWLVCDGGDLFENWVELFKVDCPPVELPISKKSLKDIGNQMRLNFEDIRRVIAMCIRRLPRSATIDSAPQLERSLLHFFTEPMSYGLRLKDKYDALMKYEGWTPEILADSTLGVGEYQLNNYHKKMRYIAWGLSGNAELKSGKPFTTKFYKYSRALDERFFNSLDESRNKELIALLDDRSKCEIHKEIHVDM